MAQPPSQPVAQPMALPLTLPLTLPAAVVRTFDTPGFAGIRFYEVQAKSIISRVAASSRMPFQWTLNPYRGCGHACRYCFARHTHTYLDLDPGADFDTRIVVKVNAPGLLRRELAARSWAGGRITMGANVDCYQRAEGRYRLMRGIISALRDFANPFSITTKGTLITRDLDLLRQAAQVTDIEINFSVGFLDERVWRQVEPGAPSPSRRLDAVRRLADAGFGVRVLLAPVLPGLTDTDESIDATLAAIAKSGAAGVLPLMLHLRPGAREWYLNWLERDRPELLPRYRELYGRGSSGWASYAPVAYEREVAARVAAAARRHRIGRQAEGAAAFGKTTPVRTPAPAPVRAFRRAAAPHADPPEQLTLL